MVDYATKFCLSSIARPTGTANDAIEAIYLAELEARQQTGLPLILDCYDNDNLTDQWHPLRMVSDNGPCYKSTSFAKLIPDESRD